MKNISKLAIDIGHNVSFDGGAVGIKDENSLNLQVGTKLIEKCRAAGIIVIDCTPSSAKSLNDSFLLEFVSLLRLKFLSQLQQQYIILWLAVILCGGFQESLESH